VPLGVAVAGGSVRQAGYSSSGLAGGGAGTAASVATRSRRLR
jgi:hypothetical protein